MYHDHMRYCIALVLMLTACGGQPDGLTPLVSAARAGDLATITALLDAGADVDERSGRNQWTPLLHAIHAQRPAAVRLLLERGADPNMRPALSMPPIAMAAGGREGTTVQALIEYG